MNVHLIIPALLPLQGDAAPPAVEPHLPALETLLARGRRTRGEADHLEGWLCAQFGVARQHDWPVAPYAFAGEGGQPGTDYWLRADPVHLVVATDQLVLADAEAALLSRQEAEALVETMNLHFSGQDMLFYPLRPDAWYLRLAQAPELQTTPIGAARGRAIDALLPAGADAKRWHACLNEIQMLLHEHAVNEARDARGAPVINSVWLWGGGTLATPSRRAFARLRSADPFASGLVQAAGGAAPAPLPSAREWLAQTAREGVEALLLDELRAPAARNDAVTWRAHLEALERSWFAPLLEALRAGRIGMLTLHAIGAQGVLDVEATRQDLRRFWRARKPLGAWA